MNVALLYGLDLVLVVSLSEFPRLSPKLVYAPQPHHCPSVSPSPVSLPSSFSGTLSAFSPDPDCALWLESSNSFISRSLLRIISCSVQFSFVSFTPKRLRLFPRTKVPFSPGTIVYDDSLFYFTSRTESINFFSRNYLSFPTLDHIDLGTPSPPRPLGPWEHEKRAVAREKVRSKSSPESITMNTPLRVRCSELIHRGTYEDIRDKWREVTLI